MVCWVAKNLWIRKYFWKCPNQMEHKSSSSLYLFEMKYTWTIIQCVFTPEFHPGFYVLPFSSRVWNVDITVLTLQEHVSFQISWCVVIKIMCPRVIRLINLLYSRLYLRQDFPLFMYSFSTYYNIINLGFKQHQ